MKSETIEIPAFMKRVEEEKRNYEREMLKKRKKAKVARKKRQEKVRVVAMGLTTVFLTIGTVSHIKELSKEKIIEIGKDQDLLRMPKEEETDFHLEEPTVEMEVDLKAEEPEKESVFLDFSDRSMTEDIQNTKERYYEVIKEYAHRYGLDPDLMTALATQERGIHGYEVDPGGAIGLMQIQVSAWEGETLTAYNFDTNSYETISVDTSSLSNLEENVKVGCMIFQSNLRELNYNPLLSLQAYNMGIGTAHKLARIYAEESGISKEEVLENKNDFGWMNYRDEIPYGDPRYIEHVISYLGSDFTIQNKTPDGDIISIHITNMEKEKVY